MPRRRVAVRSPECSLGATVSVGLHAECTLEGCVCQCHARIQRVQLTEEERAQATVHMFPANDGDPAARQLIVRSAAAQSVSIQEWQDSAGTVWAAMVCNVKETVYTSNTVVYRVMPYEWDTELSQILYRQGVQEVVVVRDNGEMHVYTRTEEERWATYRTMQPE